MGSGRGKVWLALLLLPPLLLWSPGRGLAKKRCNDEFFLDVTKDKCMPCKMCEGIFEYKQKCSNTTDAICRCTPRYQCSGKESVCEKCPCGSGKQLMGKDCQSCPDGEFNDQAGGRCRPWTKCPGDRILTNGSKTKDVKCRMVPEGTTMAYTTPVITFPAVTERDGQLFIVISSLTVALLLCVLSLLIISIAFKAGAKRKLLAIFVKQPFGQLAQEVDDCSCRYPEEESHQMTHHSLPSPISYVKQYSNKAQWKCVQVTTGGDSLLPPCDICFDLKG